MYSALSTTVGQASVWLVIETMFLLGFVKLPLIAALISTSFPHLNHRILGGGRPFALTPTFHQWLPLCFVGPGQCQEKFALALNHL